MRLLLVLVCILFVAGCAKPPVVELEDVRSVVAHAYASGAARHAPGEYQLASSALLAAEQQVKDGEHRKALRTLALARRYSSEALTITLVRKQQMAAEQQRLAEEKRIEEAQIERQLELQRLEELRKQKELQKKLAQPLLKKKAKPAPIAKKAPVEPPKPQLVDQIEVLPGENLAMIAARAEVYNDALLWPLIYKANRDQIKDPIEIFTGQVFVIPRDKNREEAEAARLEARELNLF
ncbi:MAG: hypothetical protein OQK50_03310 [Deltaproteobacteria bacterium]|nr:hypothetical protein [Deltaproteobacteria bacterium]MCW8891705.1 hypothetical protein [Deltaproteobacteria bacterium]MCW9049342.1 hypothetical protein [Deltaproteobacteria bacterium]